MAPTAASSARSLPLAWQLALWLGGAAVAVAILLGLLGARHIARLEAAAVATSERSVLLALADRAAPLLDRRDWVRLAALAGVAGDQLQARVLVLDHEQSVVLDTGHGLLGATLPAQDAAATEQRLVRRDPAAGADSPWLREAAAPIRSGGGRIGELRLQRQPLADPPVFDAAWFGFGLLGGLSLVALAVGLALHWSGRLQQAAAVMQRVAAGESGGEWTATGADFQGLGLVLQQLEAGVQEGLQQVGAGYAAMALQLVEGLERHRLVPRGRGERCARLSLQLADRLQLPATERADLELAARLVDFGKAFVRPAILVKQGPLQAEELASLRQHPQRAGEHLEPMPTLRQVAAIVRHQAERFDGCGPQGLRGERIPLGARVLAITAAFDEWTTGAGDASLHWSEALARLASSAGECFDPGLVEMFAEIVACAPPQAVTDRQVLIVPAGSEAWPVGGGEEAEDGDALADELEEIEVVLEEPQPPEAS